MSFALMDLSMDVAPSQMMGFPFIDWGGAVGAAGGAVDGAVDAVDVTGAVDAAAALPTGVVEGLGSDVGA